MKRAITSLCICATLSFAGCVDRGFDIADVSGEVTLGGEELVVPLADISPILLSDLIEENEFFNSGGENGTYQIAYTSYGDDPTKYERISIDGISIPNITGLSPQLEPITFSFGSLPTSLIFSAINKPIDIDFPTKIGDIMKIAKIDLSQPIEFSLPGQLAGQGTIDDRTLGILEMMELTTISATGESEVVFDATLEILEQLEKVDWVEFGCKDHPYGAPFQLNIDLLGIHDVVESGTLKLNVVFPEGYYLRDENGTDFPVATHNILSKEIALGAKQEAVDVLLYLHKIDYSDHTFKDGKLEINDHIIYSYDISVKLGKGSYNLNSMPQLAIKAEPQYKDVEVKINHFEIPKQEHTITNSFNGMPSGVEVEKIAFTKPRAKIIAP